MTKVRVRAIATKGNDVGKKRYELYRNAFSRINKAIDDGYFLEAITLTESLLADRLESRLSFLKNKNIGFKTLGQLSKDIQKIEIDTQFKELVGKEVTRWWGDRNTYLHEMVKIEASNDISRWEDRIAGAKRTAEDGRKILRKVNIEDKRLREHNRSQKTNPSKS